MMPPLTIIALHYTAQIPRTHKGVSISEEFWFLTLDPIRVIILLDHLKFWNTSCISIPLRSLLQGRQTSNWSYCSTNWNNCSMVFKLNTSRRHHDSPTLQKWTSYLIRLFTYSITFLLFLKCIFKCSWHPYFPKLIHC